MTTQNPMLEQAFNKAIKEREEQDAAQLANDRLEARRTKIRRAAIRTYVIITATLLLVVGALIGWGYYQYTQPAKRFVDYRTCTYVDEANKIELTGTREYSYQQREVFGVQFRQNKDTQERTTLDVRGTAMTVVGLSEGSWYSSYVGTGEKGVEILKPAQLYIVTMDKKVAVFEYAAFCQ